MWGHCRLSLWAVICSKYFHHFAVNMRPHYLSMYRLWLYIFCSIRYMSISLYVYTTLGNINPGNFFFAFDHPRSLRTAQCRFVRQYQNFCILHFLVNIRLLQLYFPLSKHVALNILSSNFNQNLSVSWLDCKTIGLMICLNTSLIRPKDLVRISQDCGNAPCTV